MLDQPPRSKGPGSIGKIETAIIRRDPTYGSAWNLVLSAARLHTTMRDD